VENILHNELGEGNGGLVLKSLIFKNTFKASLK